MDTSTDMEFLFPPPVLAWLRARGCEQIARVPARGEGAGGSQWVEFDLDIGSSPGDGAALCLRLRDPAALDLHSRLMLADYLTALRPFLADIPSDAVKPGVTLPQATVVDVEHQLRNHLNSLLMNAGVLGLRCDDRADTRAVLDQMESDAAGCLGQLQRLFAPRA